MIYVLEIKLYDGRRIHTVQIRREGADWETQLDEAVQYFENFYKDEGTVDILYGSNLYSMGVSNPEEVPSWATYRASLDIDRSLEEPTLYILEVCFNNQQRTPMVKILSSSPNWKIQLEEAAEYFTNIYLGQGYVHFVFELASGNIDDIPDWPTYRVSIKLP